MGENIIVIGDPRTCCFNFGLPKDVDENLKREIEFIIKSNKFLAEIIYVRMYATLYTSKRRFWKSVNFGLVALTFHYGSFFNASLPRYTS